MDMYLFVPLVYFSCIQASWCYFVSNTTATWTEQYADCKLATPTIQYEGLELDVTIDQQFQHQELWVGYYQHMALFDYIGCMKTQNVKSKLATIISLDAPTPGRCFSACAYKSYIGINKRECYCFDMKPGGNITEQGCNLPCDDMSQTVCSGKDHISLYTPSTKDTDLVANSGDGKCLQINFYDQGDRYNWRDCNDVMWATCSSDSQQSIEILEERLSWNGAAKECFKRNLYPSRLEDIDLVEKTDFYSWTGVIHSSVISKNIELGMISSDILYGYMTSEGSSKYVLKFTQTNDNKHSLCENRIVTVSPNTPLRTRRPQPTTTQTFHLTTSRDDSNDSSTDTRLTKITVSNTTPTKVNDPTKSHVERKNTQVTEITVSNATPTQVNDPSKSHVDRQNTQGSGTTLYVIFSVLVVMLIAVAIVISIQVKRKKIPHFCQRKQTTKEPGQKHSKRRINQASFGNSSYEQVDFEDNDKCGQSADSNYTHTYDAQEEQAKDSTIGDTTCDVSGNDRKTTITESENISNKLKQPDDSATYDHTYNATQHGLQTPDVTHDTTSEDVAIKSTETHNVYSAQGQAGNDKINVAESHNNSEDTNSQINNPKNGSRK